MSDKQQFKYETDIRNNQNEQIIHVRTDISTRQKPFRDFDWIWFYSIKNWPTEGKNGKKKHENIIISMKWSSDMHLEWVFGEWNMNVVGIEWERFDITIRLNSVSLSLPFPPFYRISQFHSCLSNRLCFTTHSAFMTMFVHGRMMAHLW